jgi:hypothetical protein
MKRILAYAALVVSTLGCPDPVMAQADPNPAVNTPDTGTVKAAESPEAATQKAWRESLSQAPLPKKGCYEASYPDTGWREVPCKAVQLKPYLPVRAGERIVRFSILDHGLQ